MKSFYLFIFLLCFVFQASIAQISITGIVLDSKQQAIEFANVFLVHADDRQITIGAISQADGRFSLDVPQVGDYVLSISFIGFDDYKNSIRVEKSIDLGKIILESSAQVLNEVVVTADRTIIERREDKLVFNVSSSSLQSGFDGMEVLERSPNIMIYEDEILIRNEAPIVLINGRKSNLSGEDLANYLRNIRSNDIKSIEIQTHLSANTDAESSGGVINIILKKKPIGYDGSLRADYNIKGRGFADAFTGMTFNYGAGKWNVYSAYNFMHRTSLSNSYNTTEYFDTQDVILGDNTWETLRIRHNYQVGFVADAFKNHVFGIEAFATNFDYSTNTTSLVSILNADELIESGDALVDVDLDNNLYNTTFNYTWTIDTMKSNLKVFVDYSNQKVNRNNEVASTYDVGLYEDNTEQNKSIANTLIYASQADLEQYFENFKLEAGAKWTYTDRENALASAFLNDDIWIPNDRSTAYNYDERVIAGYLSLSKTIQEKNFIKIGLRVENTNLNRLDLNTDSTIQQNYTNWFPSFYFSRDLPNKQNLALSYSKRLRRPPFYFLNNNVTKVNDFRYELGNPDLTPEYVHNFELTWRQKNQSIGLYYDKVMDAINGIYFLEGQIAYYQKFNAGSQTQYGVDYNLFGNLFKWWYAKTTLVLYHRKFTDEVGVDSFERTTVRASVSNNFKINSTTSFDITAAYVSPYEDAYYISYGRRYVNMMLQKTFWNKRLTCRIYFNDVFNSLMQRSERPFENFKTTREDTWLSQSVRLWATYRFQNKHQVNKRTNKSKNEMRRRL